MRREWGADPVGHPWPQRGEDSQARRSVETLAETQRALRGRVPPFSCQNPRPAGSFRSRRPPVHQVTPAPPIWRSQEPRPLFQLRPGDWDRHSFTLETKSGPDPVQPACRGSWGPRACSPATPGRPQGGGRGPPCLGCTRASDTRGKHFLTFWGPSVPRLGFLWTENAFPANAGRAGFGE